MSIAWFIHVLEAVEGVNVKQFWDAGHDIKLNRNKFHFNLWHTFCLSFPRFMDPQGQQIWNKRQISFVDFFSIKNFISWRQRKIKLFPFEVELFTFGIKEIWKKNIGQFVQTMNITCHWLLSIITDISTSSNFSLFYSCSRVANYFFNL